MFTLLTEEQKKKLIVEYRLRLLVAFLFFVTIALFSLTMLMLPSYLSARGSYLDLIQKQSDLTKIISEKSSGDLSRVIDDLRKNLSVADVSSGAPSMLFELISRESGEQIRLTEFTYSTKDIPGQTILRVKGSAFDRKSLIAYQKNLEKHKEFSKVDFPISNLAKDTNINFEMTIIGSI